MRNEITTLAKIKVERPRRRLTNPDRVDHLAESIQEIGLLNPLTVTENGAGTYRLIAGYHRLQALQKIEAVEVAVRVVTTSDALADLAEIDENLIRSELTVIERGEAVVRRKEIFELLHPETKHGTAGAAATSRSEIGTFGKRDDLPPELNHKCPKCKADVGLWCQTAKGTRCLRTHPERRALAEKSPTQTSFTQDTAAKTGRSKRTVQEDVQIGAAMKSFPAGVRKAIEKSPLADRKKDLLEISRMDDQGRAVVFDAIETAFRADEPFATLADVWKKVETQRGVGPVKDSHGTEIPEELAEFWEAMESSPVQAVANSIRAAASHWTKAKKKLAAIHEQHGRPVARDGELRILDDGFKVARTLAKSLELLIPDMLCPACKGGDIACGGCGGSGYLPASTAKEHVRKDTSRKSSREKKAGRR